MSTRVLSLWRATRIVAWKELVAAFRDKQTTLYTIVLPIAMYPFLFWAMIQGAMFVQGREEMTEVHLGVSATRDALIPDGLTHALEFKPVDRARNKQDSGTVHAAERRVAPMKVESNPAAHDEPTARAWVKSAPHAHDSATPTRDGPDAVLWLHGPQTASDEPAPGANLYFDSSESHSQIAKKRTLSRLPIYAESLREERARAIGREVDELDPFRIDEAKDIAAEEHGGAFLLSLILPMLLVVMTVIGAFYPAVDFTAGERERNTAETTLLLPVPRLAIHQGKILAVCACAVLATTLNLLALGLSAGHLVNMLRDQSDLEIVLPLGALAAVVPLALLFAVFVSAVLTSVAALARTFKEGQALLGPVQMLFLFPAMAGAIPGLELTLPLCFVPVVNVVLAFRSLLKGQWLPLEYGLTALTLLVLAAVSMWIALRVLRRESLSGSLSRPRLNDLFAFLRTKENLR
ncbi:MAG: ABC transporter permease subunit [Planctomycetes bacterium]|nr:ABC transporter permease subunit [Planctomycetota bacterium]